MGNSSDIRRIGKATAALDGIYWNIAKMSGVKENLFWLLYALDDGEFHTQKQICDDWLFPKTTINTLIKECEVDGYVILQAIPGRKRELQICLTDKGQAYAKQVMKSVYEIENKALSAALEKCSPSFIADLELFVGELQTVFENYKHTERG
ncbi:MarR family winged helix-turn-helix transcriptional regulator [Desulfosporosinus meridiei]|uniref:Transcriptional regulator n=1 Tax=Desulfosporosinus meridiei (strain ATCC BAA-275 / DSM 13257 / KCTC 12902 / NCIMB 13706 / S10) TaxID=768704 RepID=J7IXG6_DESMD|nr:MarR family winged helix-turn-helix transcriptional regulator [Desulfosporosinus meridiei]AFQ43788.1 transcriptional regulator [Desulfosporosinus meridiei DSM 13257]